MPLTFLLEIVAVVLIGLVVARWLMKRAIGDKVTDPDPLQQAEMAASAAQVRTVPSSGAPPAPTPFTLRLATSSWWSSAQWSLGASFGALCLFGDPTLLWTAWLSYPAGAGLVLIALVSAWSAWTDWRSRLVVSASGLELWHGSTVDARLHWLQVAHVAIVEHWGRRSRHGSTTFDDTYLSSRKLTFTDAHGRTLMEMDEPLRPAAGYRDLLDAIPTWTGVAVVRERRNG